MPTTIDLTNDVDAKAVYEKQMNKFRVKGHIGDLEIQKQDALRDYRAIENEINGILNQIKRKYKIKTNNYALDLEKMELTIKD